MKIMVVDDDVLMRRGLAKMLAELGGDHDVRIAGDAFCALEMLKTCHADLIITDVNMPEMNGLEFISVARQSGFCRHFVILSGYAEFSYAQRAIELGVESYLLKPVDKGILLTKVRDIFRNIWLERQTPHEKVSDVTATIHAPITDDMTFMNTLNEVAESCLQGDEAHVCTGLVMITEIVLRNTGKLNVVRDFLSRSVNSKGEVSAQLYHMLNTMCEPGNLTAALVKTLTFTMENYRDKNIALSVAAENLGFHPNYLSSLIGRGLDVSYSRFVNLIRISLAQEMLLENKTMTMQEVSTHCGFENVNHFFRVFKQNAGMTPGDFRKHGERM